MAKSAPPGVPAPTATPAPDNRTSGFCYQNWEMNGAPPIIINPAASLHHKLAWLWGEVSLLSDAAHELCTEDNKQLRWFSNFITSRLMPMEAMLDHLGDITRNGETK